jgi:hypothetical protein
MDTGIKKFRDKRLDAVKMQNLGVFSGKSRLDLMKAKGLDVEHSNAPYLERFHKHEMEGKTALVGERGNAVLGQGKSVLSESLKDQRIEKPKMEPEGSKTELKKQIDRIKEAMKRAKTQ